MPKTRPCNSKFLLIFQIFGLELLKIQPPGIGNVDQLLLMQPFLYEHIMNKP